MKKAVIKHLDQIADLLEFKNANQFKVAAFRNAARTIKNMSEEINEVYESGDLEKTKGIGKSIYNTIVHFLSHGTSPAFDELTEDTPLTIFDLLDIRGLGPKKVALLYKELQIQNLSQLHQAVIDGSIRNVKGFGEALIAQISIEIDRISSAKEFIFIHQAHDLSEHILVLIAKCPSMVRVHESGKLLLTREVYSSLEFTVLTNSADLFISELSNYFTSLKKVENGVCVSELEIPIYIYITSTIATYSQMILDKTVPHELDGRFQILKEEFPNLYEFPFQLLETEFYEVDPLGLQLKPSNFGDTHLQGMFHFHTTWSDGLNSLEEMIVAGKQYGYSYFAVTDHSKTAVYANGLSRERVILQREEIIEVAGKHGVRIFSGIESDILTDGSLDYDEEFLQTFDVIVASVHSHFNLSEDDMTKRIIRAVEHPKVHILGHPTGRLLLRRNGYTVNMKKVIDACAANNTVLEINANPLRLDLDWRWLPYASLKGCLFAINPDAHTADSVSVVDYGIKLASKGGIQKEQVINYFSLEQFQEFIKA